MKEPVEGQPPREWFTPVWIVPISLLALSFFYALMR
jgi:hypothetical protein